jgi:type IV secretion system protein VirD4
MDTHLARVQQRWRYADEDLSDGSSLSIERLAHDFPNLPSLAENGSPEEIKRFVDAFFDQTRVGLTSAAPRTGVESAAPEATPQQPAGHQPDRELET